MDIIVDIIVDIIGEIIVDEFAPGLLDFIGDIFDIFESLKFLVIGAILLLFLLSSLFKNRKDR